MQAFDREVFLNPPRQSWRKLSIQSDNHAARIGVLTRWLAKRRQAWMSSSSRSGCSSKICSGVIPSAKNSSTSLTRIRIPLTHGRPPHCFGFTVVRSKICVINPTSSYGFTTVAASSLTNRVSRARFASVGLKPIWLGADPIFLTDDLCSQETEEKVYSISRTRRNPSARNRAPARNTSLDDERTFPL